MNRPRRIYALGLAVVLVIAATASVANAQNAFATSKELGNPALPIKLPKNGQLVLVGSLRLPAGNYIATASLWIRNDGPSAGPAAIAYCFLFLKDAGVAVANAQVIDTLKGNEGVSQALTVAASLANAGTAELVCTNNGATGDLQLQTFNLNAISALTLQIQP